MDSPTDQKGCAAGQPAACPAAAPQPEPPVTGASYQPRPTNVGGNAFAGADVMGAGGMQGPAAYAHAMPSAEAAQGYAQAQGYGVPRGYAAPQGYGYACAGTPQDSGCMGQPYGYGNSAAPGTVQDAPYGAPFGPQPGAFTGFSQGAPGYPGAPFAPNPGMMYGPKTDAGAEHAHQEDHNGCGCHHGAPDSNGFSGPNPQQFAAMGGMFGEDPQHMQNHYGQMMAMCNDLMQGKADPAKIVSFLTSSGAHFWKGAAVGALLTFVLTNSSVKSALGDTFSSIFGGKANPEA